MKSLSDILRNLETRSDQYSKDFYEVSMALITYLYEHNTPDERAANAVLLNDACNKVLKNGYLALGSLLGALKHYLEYEANDAFTTLEAVSRVPFLPIGCHAVTLKLMADFYQYGIGVIQNAEEAEKLREECDSLCQLYFNPFFEYSCAALNVLSFKILTSQEFDHFPQPVQALLRERSSQMCYIAATRDPEFFTESNERLAIIECCERYAEGKGSTAGYYGINEEESQRFSLRAQALREKYSELTLEEDIIPALPDIRLSDHDSGFHRSRSSSSSADSTEENNENMIDSLAPPLD